MSTRSMMARRGFNGIWACAVAVALGAVAAWPLQAQVPQMLSYQGRIAVGGTNFDGAGFFKFELVDATGASVYWSHDGTTIGEPFTAVPLSVTRGLYSVLLGDTTVANMDMALTPDVFANASDVRLRVWFSPTIDGTFVQLAPDQRIASVGYAMMAATTDPNGALRGLSLNVGSGNYFNSPGGTIAGGSMNEVDGTSATVSGGALQLANADYATVGGGYYNTASGFKSTVPGGDNNWAGGTGSFAAGHGAYALNDGAFVWGDQSVDLPISSVSNNEFRVRATGGSAFISAVDADGIPLAGVQLSAGDGSWSSLADSAAMANVTAISSSNILDKVAALPVAQWNLTSQTTADLHIGPAAQDFHAAFGLAGDAQHINGSDADGVLFAAIKGLNQRLAAQDATIAALTLRVQALEQQLAGGL